MASSNRGRRKIEMTIIKKKSNLQVTFSKRKLGLFKKACELCTLCGVEIGIIVFSPSQKVFSFGNPDIISVINRFKNRGPLRLMEGGPDVIIEGLNDFIPKVAERLETEIKSKNVLDYIQTKREEIAEWWQKSPNELDLTQTTDLISAVEDMKNELISQTCQTTVPQNFHGGGGGGNIDLSDQRRMIDVNAFNSNPNTTVPSRAPMFGYNDNNNVSELFGPEYNTNVSMFNHNHY